MRLINTRLLLSLALVTSWLKPAIATPVTFKFEGEIFSVISGGVFASTSADSWSLLLTYDPDLLVATPLGDGFRYQTAPGETSITLAFATDSESFASDNSQPIRIYVENTPDFLATPVPGAGQDRFSVDGYFNAFTTLNLVMVESLGANPLSSDDLPTTGFGAGVGSDWTVSELDVDRTDVFANISGSVSTIQLVPDGAVSVPDLGNGAWLLAMSLGLCAAAAARRHRKNAPGIAGTRYFARR